MSEILFAAEIAFRRLDRGVFDPQQVSWAKTCSERGGWSSFYRGGKQGGHSPSAGGPLDLHTSLLYRFIYGALSV